MIATTVWGTLPTWILVVLAIGAAYRITRGGGGAAVTELSKANEVLTKRNHELGSEVRDMKVHIARLEAETNFALQIGPLVAWSEGHEQRAQERHAATLNVLEMIASRLGADPNGEHA